MVQINYHCNFLLDVPEIQKGVPGHGWWHLEGKHPFLTSDQIIDYLRRVAVRTQKLNGGLCFCASIFFGLASSRERAIDKLYFS